MRSAKNGSMRKPYVYIAASKKVPKHRIDVLIGILHDDYGVPMDQIKMHEKGDSYNAKKAQEAALVIGVTHNLCQNTELASRFKFKFPKGSYSELYHAVIDEQGGEYEHFIYDYRNDEFFMVDSVGEFDVLDENDWSNKYGEVNAYEHNIQIGDELHCRIITGDRDYFDDETGEYYAEGLINQIEDTSDDNILLLLK